MKLKYYSLILAGFIFYTSCEEEKSPSTGAIEINSFKVLDTTQVSCKIIVSLENKNEVDNRGIYLYDSNMVLIDSVNLKINSSEGEFNELIKGLKRGNKYNAQAFLYDNSLGKILSNTISFKLHSFTILNMFHQNSSLSFTVNGVRPGEKIYLIGKNLDDFNDDCEILIKDSIGWTQITDKSDTALTFTIKKKVNNTNWFGYSEEKEVSIIVKEQNMIIGDQYIINLFPDAPFIDYIEMEDNSHALLYGRFGDIGPDSVFFGNKKHIFNRAYGNTLYYYNQVHILEFNFEPSLTTGIYDIKVYLNGYEASLSGVVVE